MGHLKESRLSDPLIMGAVAYDQKVVTIWDGFQQYFRTRGLEFDYVLFSNYERQVAAHAQGHLHIAWNSPLAWLQTGRVAQGLGRRAEAICMRDTDRDLRSIVLVRSDSGIDTVADLKGRVVAVGAGDSPQATLIPLNYLAEQGVEDLQVEVCDVLAGKHGITSAASVRRSGRCSVAPRTPPASSTRTIWSLRGKGPFRAARREFSPRRPPTITATSRNSTMPPPSRSPASSSSSSACRMAMPRFARCSISKG